METIIFIMDFIGFMSITGAIFSIIGFSQKNINIKCCDIINCNNEEDILDKDEQEAINEAIKRYKNNIKKDEEYYSL